jgi:hypothetical protein
MDQTGLLQQPPYDSELLRLTESILAYSRATTIAFAE